MYTPSDKPVQLAKHLHKVPEKKRVFPAMSSVKYDGVFAFGMPDGRVFSRVGNECHSLKQISAELRAADAAAARDGLMPHVLLFEVYVPEWPVQEISGAFRRQTTQFESAIIMLHDAIPEVDFEAGVCKVPYKYRYDIVQYFVRTMPSAREVHQRTVQDEVEATQRACDIIAAGGEGVILRNPQGTWVAGKRNADLVKIKQEETLDLRVVGVHEGLGKYKGTTGTITVAFNGGVQHISGMTDFERGEWMEHPDFVVDRIVEVQFMCLTPDGWMREPRYKMVRYDKRKADNE